MSNTEQSTSTPTASSSAPVKDTPLSFTIAGHSTPTPAASSSLQPVGGVSASAIQAPHQRDEDENQCISPVPYSHYRTGHDGQAIDDAFEPEPSVCRARGHIAVFASTSSHQVNRTPMPSPETTPDEEETALSSHSRIDWPDSHEQDWAHRVIQDTNTEPGQ